MSHLSPPRSRSCMSREMSSLNSGRGKDHVIVGDTVIIIVSRIFVRADEYFKLNRLKGK